MNIETINFKHKQVNKGSAVIVFILVILLILIGLGTGAYFLFKEGIIEDPVESAIGNLVAKEFGSEFENVKVSITNREGIYMSGFVLDNSGQSKNFYTVFTGGVWRLVAVDNAVSCERLESLGFSSGTLSGCVNRYSNAKTVVSIVEESEVGDDEVEIIGIVSFVDPSGGSFSISSGGKSVVVSGGNGVEVGDTAVVVGTINDSSTVTASSVIDVGEEDDDLVEEINSNNSGGSTNNNNSNDEESGDDDNTKPGENTNIPEPQSSAGSGSDDDDEYNFNIWDLDEESLIRLRND